MTKLNEAKDLLDIIKKSDNIALKQIVGSLDGALLGLNKDELLEIHAEALNNFKNDRNKKDVEIVLKNRLWDLIRTEEAKKEKEARGKEESKVSKDKRGRTDKKLKKHRKKLGERFEKFSKKLKKDRNNVDFTKEKAEISLAHTKRRQSELEQTEEYISGKKTEILDLNKEIEKSSNKNLDTNKNINDDRVVVQKDTNNRVKNISKDNLEEVIDNVKTKTEIHKSDMDRSVSVFQSKQKGFTAESKGRKDRGINKAKAVDEKVSDYKKEKIERINNTIEKKKKWIDTGKRVLSDRDLTSARPSGQGEDRIEKSEVVESQSAISLDVKAFVEAESSPSDNQSNIEEIKVEEPKLEEVKVEQKENKDIIEKPKEVISSNPHLLDGLDENNLDFNIPHTGNEFITYGNKKDRKFDILESPGIKESTVWREIQGGYGVIFYGGSDRGIRGGGNFGLFLQIPRSFEEEEKEAVKSIISDALKEIVNSESVKSIRIENNGKNLVPFGGMSKDDIKQIEKILREKIIEYKTKLSNKSVESEEPKIEIKKEVKIEENKKETNPVESKKAEIKKENPEVVAINKRRKEELYKMTIDEFEEAFKDIIPSGDIINIKSNDNYKDRVFRVIALSKSEGKLGIGAYNKSGSTVIKFIVPICKEAYDYVFKKYDNVKEADSDIDRKYDAEIREVIPLTLEEKKQRLSDFKDMSTIHAEVSKSIFEARANDDFGKNEQIEELHAIAKAGRAMSAIETEDHNTRLLESNRKYDAYKRVAALFSVTDPNKDKVMYWKDLIKKLEKEIDIDSTKKDVKMATKEKSKKTVEKKEFSSTRGLPKRTKNYENIGRKETKDAIKERHLDKVKVLEGELRTIIGKDNKSDNCLVMKSGFDEKKIKKIIVDEDVYKKLFVHVFPNRMDQFPKVGRGSILKVLQGDYVNECLVEKGEERVIIKKDTNKNNNIILESHEDGEFEEETMSINEKEFNSLFMPKKNTVSQSQKNESKKENEIKEVNSEALTKLKTTLFKLKNNKQDVSLKELRDSKEKNSGSYADMSKEFFDTRYKELLSEYGVDSGHGKEEKEIREQIIKEIGRLNKHRHENIKWKQVSKKPEIKKEVKTEKTKIETKSEVEITEPKTEISQTEVKKESAPEVAERTSKLEPENNSIKTIEVGSIEAISQHSGLSIQEKIEDLENYLKVFNSKKIESIWKFFLGDFGYKDVKYKTIKKGDFDKRFDEVVKYNTYLGWGDQVEELGKQIREKLLERKNDRYKKMKRNKIDSQIEQKESVFDSTNIPNISNIHKHIKRLKEQMAAPIELQDTNILYKLDNNGDYIDSGMYDENSKRKSNSIHGEKAIMKDKNNLPKVQEFFNSRKKELEGLESGIVQKIDQLSQKKGGLGGLQKFLKENYTTEDVERPVVFENFLSDWIRMIILSGKLDRVNEILDLELNK